MINEAFSYTNMLYPGELVANYVDQLGHDFPECCLIIGNGISISTDEEIVGSGVVIAHNRVLTAGHVVGKRLKISVSFAYNTQRVDDEPKVYSEVKWVHKHADFAILEFAKDTFKSWITIADKVDYEKCDFVTCVGYGSTSTHMSGDSFGQKNYLEKIPFLNSQEKMNAVSESNHIDDPVSEFVIGGGVCDMDSGGPVFTNSGVNRKLLGIMIENIPSTSLEGCLRESLCIKAYAFSDQELQQHFSKTQL